MEKGKFMPNTIPDVLVSNSQFVDVNTLSSLVAGTAMILTNKSTSRMLVQTAAGQPAADSTDGEILSILPPTTAVKLITAGESTVWAKSFEADNAPLSVQDNT